jgi:ribosomal-protein-serine acetyltransferase
MSSEPLRIRVDDSTELRTLEEKDATVFYRLIENNRVHLREWLPWLDNTLSVEDERLFIRLAQTQYMENKAMTCGIWYRGQAAGTISYHPVDWVNRKVEIGYWLGAEFQGRGLMTKACSALIEYAFSRLMLNKVEIRCAVGNLRSCAIPQRLGFKQEGIIRQGEWLYNHFVDLNLYGLLSSEWQQRVQETTR